MMKIGLLTFVCSQNWGALLQGYSTQEFINRNTEHQCDCLNWEPVDNSLLKPYKTIPNLIHSVLHIFKCKQRIDKFQQFRDDYLKLSRKCFTDEERKSLNSEYDSFIVGSDQVWNTTDRVNPVMFLDFVSKDNKKIAYAPSFGSSHVDDRHNEELKKYIDDFDAVSVRETSGVNIIRKFSDIPVDVVLDPVFLNTKDFWKSHAKAPEVREKYIFLYPTQITKEFCAVVKKIKEKYKLPIYTPFYVPGCKTVKNMGILDFIGWIENAEYVFATSFHAVVFSIVFEKEFWAMPHTSTGARIVDMLSLLGMENCLVEDADDINLDKKTDYETVSKRVMEKAEESRAWLKKALQ